MGKERGMGFLYPIQPQENVEKWSQIQLFFYVDTFLFHNSCFIMKLCSLEHFPEKKITLTHNCMKTTSLK